MVAVLSSTRERLMPCSERRARVLLHRGRAAIFRYHPFTIILQHRETGAVQPLALVVEAGKRSTSFTAVGERGVAWSGTLQHRADIQRRLAARKALRNGRRSRKTRYRQSRFLNRTTKPGWLPPSVEHRVATATTWARRLINRLPIDAIHFNRVKTVDGGTTALATVIPSRNALAQRLGTLGLPVVPCNSATPPKEATSGLTIKAMGHGCRRMCQPDRFGFPVKHRMSQRTVYGFRSGDIVAATVPKPGKAAITKTGRVTVRLTGSFTLPGKIYAHHSRVRLLQRNDGYAYGR